MLIQTTYKIPTFNSSALADRIAEIDAVIKKQFRLTATQETDRQNDTLFAIGYETDRVGSISFGAEQVVEDFQKCMKYLARTSSLQTLICKITYKKAFLFIFPSIYHLQISYSARHRQSMGSFVSVTSGSEKNKEFCTKAQEIAMNFLELHPVSSKIYAPTSHLARKPQHNAQYG